MKQKDGEIWKELYPKTLASNVFLNNGTNIQSHIDDSESDFNIITKDEDGVVSETIIFNNKLFIFSATANIDTITQGKYLRRSVIFPFDNALRVSATATLVSSTTSLENTTQIYIREKHPNRVQVSSIGNYVAGDSIVVDVQVIGLLI